MRIGVFGGTFNPPHVGHADSAKAAFEQLRLDLLLVIPAGVPPHKELPPGSLSSEMRLEMTRTTFGDVPGFVVSDIEVCAPGPSYTVDTIDIAKKDYPEARIYLLMGTDMYLSLDTWKDSERLLRNAVPAVFSRGERDKALISDYMLRINGLYGAKTETIDNNVVDISSSILRDMLPLRGGVGYIADTTYSYIVKNRLYGAKPDWDWLRERAHAMLDPARIPHVAGCEQEALRLAERWNVNLDDAREAGILHDITKKLAPEEHIKILEDHGISTGMTDSAEVKLLHSRSGAELAKAMFGVSCEVADAIQWHTTGRAGMTALEKVIYLADYIEPNRDFEGVGRMRELAYDDMDAAMRMGLEMSIKDLLERGITPNKKSIDAFNDLQ